MNILCGLLHVKDWWATIQQQMLQAEMTQFTTRDRAVGRDLGSEARYLPFRLTPGKSKKALFLFSSKHPRRRPKAWSKGFVVSADGMPEIGHLENLGESVQFVVDARYSCRSMLRSGNTSPSLVLAEITFMERFQTLTGPKEPCQ